ncbi:MAG TPA: response regulator [Blastocatellia bacterium]|nr:response regulator [Blastocatellia bacterium]
MYSQRKRILYVDDDADTREVIVLLLEMNGYEAKAVATIAEGLEMARGERFDLYLLDRRFPDGDGIELCRQIRFFDADTPIVFFSALAYESDRQRGLRAGAQAYLIKPFDEEAFFATISRLLEDREATDDRQSVN